MPVGPGDHVELWKNPAAQVVLRESYLEALAQTVWHPHFSVWVLADLGPWGFLSSSYPNKAGYLVPRKAIPAVGDILEVPRARSVAPGLRVDLGSQLGSRGAQWVSGHLRRC